MSTVYVVVCGAGPASDVGVLVGQAHDRSHRVCLVATRAALPMLDRPALEAQTGRPVRVDHQPADRLPRAAGVIVAPATYNTINKWAAGIADTYPGINDLSRLLIQVWGQKLGRGSSPVRPGPRSGNSRIRGPKDFWLIGGRCFRGSLVWVINRWWGRVSIGVWIP